MFRVPGSKMLPSIKDMRMNIQPQQKIHSRAFINKSKTEVEVMKPYDTKLMMISPNSLWREAFIGWHDG